MSPPVRFLDVEHEVIVEKKPPYFLGDMLPVKVKVRNLKPNPIKRRFMYFLDFSEGCGEYMMKALNLGPNEELIYDCGPPFYLRSTGSFQFYLVTGDAGRKFNDSCEIANTKSHVCETLFLGIIRDQDSYKIRQWTFFLTIVMLVFAALELGIHYKILIGMLKSVLGIFL